MGEEVLEALEQIRPLNKEASQAAKRHWDLICKPLASLGRLETLLIQLAGIQGKEEVDLDKKAVLTFCSDNGVVAQGISQSDQSVTSTCAGSLLRHQASVSVMAGACGADPYVIDVGMASPVEGVLDRSLARGTQDISVGPAMTRDQAIQALQVGFDLVGQAKEKGYKIIAEGEMGIGNTTTSAAMAAVLLDLPVKQVTGRGAGLTDEGLDRKNKVIAKAIQVNQPDPKDPVGVLAKLGGFDIGAMAGACIGGAYYRVPIVMDGLISGVAVLLASRINPLVKDFVLPSHATREPAGAALLDNLDFHPIIHADMKLGEGTGAVCLFPILDLAGAVYYRAASFSDNAMDPYEKLSDD